MDKPLSQERLSEEDLNVIEYVLIQQKVEISYDSQLLMFAELKRLQAIESALTEIATSDDLYYIGVVTHQQYARDILNIGDDDHE